MIEVRMKFFRIILSFCFLGLVTGCATKQTVVPENFPFEFKDNNPHQLASARKYGIDPLEDRSQLKKVQRTCDRGAQEHWGEMTPVRG